MNLLIDHVKNYIHWTSHPATQIWGGVQAIFQCERTIHTCQNILLLLTSWLAVPKLSCTSSTMDLYPFPTGQTLTEADKTRSRLNLVELLSLRHMGLAKKNGKVQDGAQLNGRGKDMYLDGTECPPACWASAKYETTPFLGAWIRPSSFCLFPSRFQAAGGQVALPVGELGTRHHHPLGGSNSFGVFCEAPKIQGIRPTVGCAEQETH